MRSYLGVALSLIILVGCGTTMVVTPDLKRTPSVDFRVNGKVIYDGNREYLPRTIVDTPVGESGLTFQYTYDVIHGKDNVPQLLPLFNPLTIVGFPIGEDTVVIMGRLEILKRKEVVKTYTATCGLHKTRNVFWQGETFSELRRTGLVAVRDNIEAQMDQDQELLSRLAAD
ncbi:MAG: hypothetical protein HY694_13280 [Deltaproteobacteria bacterium]|nr:hypothetical protein [Deltaproteobacteria bacterium]